MINFNTDLAVERNDIYRKANNIENNIEGIETEEEEVNENVKISRVKIIDEKGAEALGKPVGSYITVDIKKLKIADNNEILVVGLGNAYVTPDSLRAKSCKRY